MMPRPPPRKLRSERVEGRRTFWALVLASGLFASLGVVHASTRLQVLELNYAVGRAQVENDRLHRGIKDVELELHTLQRTARVDAEAGPLLGMHRPGPDRKIILGPASAIPAPATAVPAMAPTPAKSPATPKAVPAMAPPPAKSPATSKAAVPASKKSPAKKPDSPTPAEVHEKQASAPVTHPPATVNH